MEESQQLNGQELSIPRLLVSGGKESPLYRSLAELKGPIGSFFGYVAGSSFLRRFSSDLDTFFGPKVVEAKPERPLSDIGPILSEVDNRLKGTGAPERFLKDFYEDWRRVAAKLETAVGSSYQLTDYVLFPSDETPFTVFFLSEGHLVPVKVDRAGFDLQKIEAQLSERSSRIKIDKLPVFGPDTGWQKRMREGVEVESAISSFADSETTPENRAKLRILSPIANDFLYKRHTVFEREGELINSLRHAGATSVGEQQELMRQLFARHVHYDKNFGVTVDWPEALQLADVWSLVTPGENRIEVKLSLQSRMETYARENVYFAMVSQFLRENPGIVNAFMNSEAYRNNAMNFVDRHLAALGSTHRGVAEAMLAGYYLYRFEGSNNPDGSPSQKFLARIPGYHQEIGSFIDAYSGTKPTIPVVRETASDLVADQNRAIEEVARSLKTKELPYSRFSSEAHPKEQRTEALKRASEKTPELEGQIRRNLVNRLMVDILERRFGLATDEERRKGIIQTVISNVGMARVRERQFADRDRFTAQTWFRDSAGYLPEAYTSHTPTPDLRPTVEAIDGNVNDSIRHIFNGEIIPVGPGFESAYESQVSRIEEEGKFLIRFLSEDLRVPQEVRKFMQTLTSPELAVRVLDHFGDMEEQDPMIVNRFFPDGFDEFQRMSVYRYLTDFVRGVETNLILATQPVGDKLGRRTLGGWKNYDFSSVPEEVLEKAIDTTLKDADHRIRVLNHEADGEKKTLKDWQEFFEKMFGWDTYDMKFLRWSKFFDLWTTLGGAWDCICFSRKSLFNPRALQQY